MSTDCWDTCPTRRLLLACLHHPQPDPATLQPLLDGPMDWEHLLYLAQRHQITPLVSRALATSTEISETVRNTLTQHRNRNARQALAQLAALGDLLARFDADQIPVLVVKGPVLAVTLHGDPGLRRCGDLDLLVDPARVVQAEALLREAGYRRQRPDFPLSPRQYRALLDATNQMAFVHPQQTLTVELHWRWFRNRFFFPPTVAAILGEHRHQNIGGLRLAAMTAEDQFLYLCAHGAKHAWYNLKWLADIPPLLNTPLDHETLIHRARQLGLRRVLAQSLLLSKALLGAVLSPTLEQLIAADPWAPTLADHARGVMARDDRRDSKIFEKLARWRYMLLLKTDLKYRWTETMGYLHHPEDWRRLPLPDRLFWLYLPLRPLLWLARRHPLASREHG